MHSKPAVVHNIFTSPKYNHSCYFLLITIRTAQNVFSPYFSIHIFQCLKSVLSPEPIFIPATNPFA